MVVQTKYRQPALFGVLLFSLVSLFLSRAGLSISMALFVALTCVHKDIGAQLKTWMRNPFLVGLTLLFFIPALSGLWSGNRQAWTSNTLIKLPLLLYPIAFAGSWQLSQKQWKIVGFTFVALVFAGAAWSMGGYLQNPAAHNEAFLRAKTFATPLGDDHVRFSWLVGIAILTLFLLWHFVPKQFRKWLLLIAAAFVVYLHVLSARTGLACFYILLGATVLRYLWLRRSLINSAWMVCLAILLPLLAWLYLPSFQNRIKYIRYDLSYAKTGTYLPGSNDGNRILSIKAGWHILKENPAGIGSGDIRDATNAWFDATVPGMLRSDRFLPSSEWLMYGGAAGWLGVLAFTLIMAAPLFVKLQHRFFWVVLHGMAAFSFLFDIGLEVQYGVFLYAFTSLWWWKWLSQKEKVSGETMQPLSVIIICKNAAGTIERSITSALPLSRDIVVYDSGSTDETLSIIASNGIIPVNGEWLGFGATRKAATLLAKNDWVLTLDADEWLSDELVREIKSLRLGTSNTAYRMQLHNRMGDHPIRWGAWGGDYRIRLFNKAAVNWSEALVHEKLLLPDNAILKTLNGSIEHQTANGFDQYRQKLERYAELTAKKYWLEGKRSTGIKRRLSPAYTFIKHFFLRLGFLDGVDGLKLSLLMSRYTRQKYEHLHRLEEPQTELPV